VSFLKRRFSAVNSIFRRASADRSEEARLFFPLYFLSPFFSLLLLVAKTPRKIAVAFVVKICYLAPVSFSRFP